MPQARASSLARFVPRVAYEWEQDAPGARCRDLDGSLCFVDISGFTALSERLALRGRIGIELLTDVLDGVFGSMLDIAFARGGSLLKFGGDALLLLFDGDGHPQQAAAAAVEMRAALRAATSEPMSFGRMRLRMSVGLHSGTVQLFRVGTLHHELIVTGPAATRTTRAEHAASAGEILVSAEMARRLPAGATRPGPGEAALLRWRRAPVEATGPRPRPTVPAEAVDACLPEVLRAHLGRGEVEFEHRIAAVAFLRFTGVDARLAAGDVDEVAGALDTVVSCVQSAAHDAGVAFLATDIDEDGGKVILASGVPRAQPDHEGRLLRALRAIADADLPLPIQAGVNDGHVFAGTIGTADRATFTVMGDTVNLAARLMAAAPPGGLYATRGVLDRARPIFASQALAPLSVKGKAQPVQAYAVGEEVGVRAAVHHDGPFVGRVAEQRQLRAVLERADGRGDPVVVVAGDTGLGKTRLVHEVLAATGTAAFTVRGEPDGTAAPYLAFRDAVRALLGVERADQATMAARLATAVEAIDPTLLPSLPLLGTVAHVAAPATPEVEAIEPRFLPDRRAAALLRLLDRALPDSAAIVVEDAQWTDGASDTLLVDLAGAVRRRQGWSMVVVRRTVAGGFTPDAPSIELGPMGDGELRELLSALSTAPLRPDEIRQVVARAAGSPLVLHALVRLGRDRGALDDLPDSLEAVIAAEIDVLRPLPRLLLGYASVLGRSFNPVVWERLLREDGIEADDRSTAALRRFLRFAPGGVGHFRHAVVRDVAYRALPFRRRRALHLRAGQVVEQLAAGAVDSVCDLLSLHFAEGGDLERAWRYAVRAGTLAKEAHANADAAALYRRALEAGRRLDDVTPAELRETWTALGDVLEQAGRPSEALDAYRRAAALARGDDLSWAQIALKRARVRERSGAFVTALRELRSAERRVADDPSPEAARVRVAATTLRAIVHEGQEQPTRALAAARLAATDAAAAGELRELAQAYGVMDWAHVSLGQLDQAVHQAAIVEIYRSLGEPHRAAAALGNQGAVLYWLGRWDEALGCYERAHEAYVMTGDVVNAAVQQANAAELLINRGDLVAARPTVYEAQETHRAVGFDDGALFDEVQIGRLLLGEGDLEGALQVLKAVRAEATEMGLHGTALDAAVHLARCLVAVGDGSGALAVLDEAEAAAGSEAAVLGGSVALARAQALAGMGDRDGARAARAVGIETARDLGLRYELGWLLLDEDGPAERAEGRALLASLGVGAPVSG